MNKRSSTRGEVLTAVLIVLAAGGLFLLFRPKATHGESRRAKEGTETTAQLVQAVDRQGASAAASVTKIGEANAQAPESPVKEFIQREVPIALAQLPTPDAQALIEAERRKVAVLAGRLEEAQRLYDQALKRADVLAKEREEAIAAKRESDLKSEQAAAEALGAEKRSAQYLVGGLVLLGLYIWAKVTHLSPGGMASLATYVRKDGDDALRALDTVTTPLQQKLVRFFSRFK